MPCRTGYERVLAHRTDDLFAKTARMEGVVEAMTEEAITIRYKDGTTVSYELGRRFGNWAGHIVPHDLKSPLKQGAKVKRGDVVLYNTNYFTPDTLDKNQVIYKPGVLARTVLWESADTYEDSSAISEALSAKLTTLDTHVRNIKVNFNQEVRNLLKVGDAVDPESILCTIHGETSASSDLYDDESLNTLSILSSNTPRAKMTGRIEKIEVIYAGEIPDMSDSLQTLAEKSDNQLRKLQKQLGRKAVEGRVDAGHRVDGHPLDIDTAVIRVYITGDVSMGVGDKAVYANQMKSVIARVMTGENTTEDGKPLDAIFGYQSLANRIVQSAELIGTTSTLAVAIGELAVKAYFGE